MFGKQYLPQLPVLKVFVGNSEAMDQQPATPDGYWECPFTGSDGRRSERR
jgi:hypothetical protein